MHAVITDSNSYQPALPHTPAGTVAGAGKAKRTQLSEEDRAALHEYLVVDFALQLLYSSMRRGALAGRAPQTLGLLDPLLPLLVRHRKGIGGGLKMTCPVYCTHAPLAESCILS